MKVWISKYALTKGLKLVEGEPASFGAFRADEEKRTQYYHRGNWHETYEQAAERAESMRTAEIRNCTKRLRKLRAMKFEVPE